MEIPSQGWQTADAIAGGHRDALIRFWLAAPTDQLQNFWAGGFGGLTLQLVSQLSAQTAFTAEQVALRNALNQRIGSLGLSQPFAHQLLIGVFMLSPPGLLKVQNAEQQLPAWLADAYKELYEAAAPVVVLGGAASTLPPQQPEAVSLPNPDFGEFPGSLAELVGNRIQLNRLLGLSNLYYIDPEDQEITQELVEMRRSLAKLIQVAPEGDLERIWATDFGDRYWALVRSGVQKEELQPADQAIRDQATQCLSPATGGGFGTPTALNAFLVSMLFYLPGSVRVEGAEQKIPAWLLETYRQVFEQAQPATA